jgi:hypothetical protein
MNGPAPPLTDRELLLVVLDRVEEIERRCIRIETRVSKLLVHMGLTHNGNVPEQVRSPDGPSPEHLDGILDVVPGQERVR